MKPALASDAQLSLLLYPLIAQAKIDGIRALNLSGVLTGRSLDPFKGYQVSEHFSRPEFTGLDGEMILGDKPNSPDRLCSLTTGAMSRFKGISTMPDIHWFVFDWLGAPDQPYEERYRTLKQKVENLANPRVHLVPFEVANNEQALLAIIAKHALEGYEGTIVRNPKAKYKEGRPTKLGMELLRFKPWLDSEALIVGVTQGNTNENEATTNRLGRTERSSAQDGMVPNGRVGSIQGILLEDIYDPVSKTLLFRKGLAVTISKGEMTNEEAAYYWENPSEIVGKIAKWSHMTHGIKDLPRFPIFKSLRMLEDM